MDGDEQSFPAQPPADRASLRIGTTDREAAVDALSEHTRAGRLSAHEYEDRSEAAKRAITWADVDSLFADLPAPHPAPGNARTKSPRPPRPAGGPGETAGSGVVHPTGRAGRADRADRRAGDRLADAEPSQGLVSPEIGRWMMAVAPPIALVLFFITWKWWFFLLIPLVSLVVYGPGGKHRRRR